MRANLDDRLCEYIRGCLARERNCRCGGSKYWQLVRLAEPPPRKEPQVSPPTWVHPGFPVPAHILRDVTPDGRVRVMCGGEWRSTAVLGHPLTWRYGRCGACLRAWMRPLGREQLGLGV